MDTRQNRLGEANNGYSKNIKISNFPMKFSFFTADFFLYIAWARFRNKKVFFLECDTPVSP